MTADDFYEDVPKEQVEHLIRFRTDHPCKHVDVAGVQWEYISCGSGSEILLILPGGLRIAECASIYIQMFEDTYRVVAPTYPPLESIDEITDGIAAILDVEHVPNAFVLGQSYGGTVAQVFVQRFPARVRKLILSSTGLPVSKGQAAILPLALAVFSSLPESWAKSLYRKWLSPLLVVPKSETSFWEAYLDELFSQRLTKADVLSFFQTVRDTIKNYAVDLPGVEPWQGEVLIIGGEKDPSSTEGPRTAMAEFYPHSQVHVIQGAGHLAAMFEPIEYAEVIKEFLKADDQGVS
jgi:pimeloyl-ACP methyl ester carboxylesterase